VELQPVFKNTCSKFHSFLQDFIDDLEW